MSYEQIVELTKGCMNNFRIYKAQALSDGKILIKKLSKRADFEYFKKLDYYPASQIYLNKGFQERYWIQKLFGSSHFESSEDFTNNLFKETKPSCFINIQRAINFTEDPYLGVDFNVFNDRAFKILKVDTMRFGNDGYSVDLYNNGNIKEIKILKTMQGKSKFNRVWYKLSKNKDNTYKVSCQLSLDNNKYEAGHAVELVIDDAQKKVHEAHYLLNRYGAPQFESSIKNCDKKAFNEISNAIYGKNFISKTLNGMYYLNKSIAQKAKNKEKAILI